MMDECLQLIHKLITSLCSWDLEFCACLFALVTSFHCCTPVCYHFMYVFTSCSCCQFPVHSLVIWSLVKFLNCTDIFSWKEYIDSHICYLLCNIFLLYSFVTLYCVYIFMYILCYKASHKMLPFVSAKQKQNDAM